MDPNEHKRVGYVTSLEISTSLVADLSVTVPTTKPKYTGISIASSGAAKVVGVMEKFEWNGGVGDAIHIDFYVSQESATQLKALTQVSTYLKSKVTLGYWIVDYDQETKQWFEQAFPATSKTVTGTLSDELSVDLTPVVVKDGIDVFVYKVTMSVAPTPSKTQTLYFANSSTKKVTKSWGLAVGMLTPAAAT
jgi:hypothetical protein